VSYNKLLLLSCSSQVFVGVTESLPTKQAIYGWFKIHGRMYIIYTQMYPFYIRNLCMHRCLHWVGLSWNNFSADTEAQLYFWEMFPIHSFLHSVIFDSIHLQIKMLYRISKIKPVLKSQVIRKKPHNPRKWRIWLYSW
jgi:hypothetical protein